MFKKFIHVQTVEAFPAELKHFHEHVKKSVNFPIPDTIVYEGSVKLHGTNVGIVVHADGCLTAQSRNRKIEVGDDNLGFAKYLSDYKAGDLFDDPDFFPNMKGECFTIYGEWVGPGVQKGTACSLLPERRFVAFSMVLESDVERLLPAPKMKAPFDNVDVVDLKLSIKTDGTNYLEEVAKAMKLTEEIDVECPWAKARGVVGHGEGIVWRPTNGNFPRLWLKTKGEAHKVKTKVSRPKEEVDEQNRVVAELYNSTDGASRVTQGIQFLLENGHEVSMKSIPHFIKWFNVDFARECKAQVTAASETSGIDEKVLRKGVGGLAVKEYRAGLLAACGEVK